MPSRSINIFFSIIFSREYTKPKALPRELNDVEYIKYIILFRIWKKYWAGLDQHQSIVDRASKFMCPSPTLRTNQKYSFLPSQSTDKATAFYVDKLNISTNKLKMVIFSFFFKYIK